MTLTLSQSAYWELIYESEENQLTPDSADEFDVTYQYPVKLGNGYSRCINLRTGLDLDITKYQLHDEIITRSSEREHLVEYTFEISGLKAGTYGFFGSGLAPGGSLEHSPMLPTAWVSVHVQPELFCQWFGYKGELPKNLQPLIRKPDQKYYERYGKTTSAMQMALQQLLGCPYQGNTKRVYLESKVWELMVLQVDQFLESQTVEINSKTLNAEDIERIHYASEILLAQLDQPPSLMELARMVGINDNKLKVGFKQVFETTVFGYLHDCRMERSRQMLAGGKLSVTETAKAVGFANRGYFAASFRRKFGVNPGIFLNEKRQKSKNSV
ncbi:AraC family transcriptional regulator [Cronbergia sp. UHCC 0137]|uniref:helix-turn-helix domain-containing protein n=1 Tax=Cronbergia sp. UHCC 0137 TaxID=3110239 RepID=UPI002B1FACF3|nr:AraC family transcriptional regulator [Cronbergia sp. UHCC 0137]MEA5618331.1 AraC family transcriptional regulator [Cronbergia sp. UHCC 0137]